MRKIKKSCGINHETVPGDDQKMLQVIQAAISAPNTHTIEPVRVGNVLGRPPEFIRWQEVRYLFGIKRGTLINLDKAGYIKSVSLRREGKARGCRLYFLPSISDYLKSLMHQ